MKRDFLRGVLTGALLASIVFLASTLARFGTLGISGAGRADSLTDSGTRGKLRMVEEIINEDYLREADYEALETYMFKGIAAGLDDRYANYYSRTENERVTQEEQGSYFGIGVVMTQVGGDEDSPEEVSRIEVVSVYEDSPAMEAGLEPGDVLTRVDGEDVSGLSLTEAIEKINIAFDSEKETVPFVFERDGEEMTHLLREAQIETARVTGEMLGDGVGYIMIPAFDGVTAAQFRDAVESLQGDEESEQAQSEAGDEADGAEGQALRALIIDVRDNPGGDLGVVTAMLDDLLDECLLLTSRNRGGEAESISAADGKIYDGEIAVLINGESASAAEVFAGTLRHYGAATLVGENSYGKGTIQHTYRLADGSAFKLTSEIYAIAGEEEIDGVGLTPDVAVEDAAPAQDSEADPVLEKALSLFKAG